MTPSDRTPTCIVAPDEMASDSDTNACLVDDAAEEFARRLRKGERPSVDEYVERYPALAGAIRAVLAGVLALEGGKSDGDRTQPMPGRPAVPVAPPAIPGFRIGKLVGRGGMGLVYAAVQEALGRTVALKVLPESLFANAVARVRFQREAQAAARLHHTGIVPVFAVGETADCVYYAMPLLDAKPLSQAAAKVTGHDPAADAKAVARIGVQVADALAHAHARGVVHRDVKPSNLLVDKHGAVWVTDFGIAKLDSEDTLTATGEVIGTLKYLPPERLHGEADARGDIYGLGASLYELLAGKPPIVAPSAAEQLKLLAVDNAPPLSRYVPGVPADLETVVMKSLARVPAWRYATADAMADDLRRFLEDRPIRARRVGPLERLVMWARRNPALAVSLASVALLLLTITGVSVFAAARTAAAHRDTALANDGLIASLEAETVQRDNAAAVIELALEAMNRTYERFTPTRLVAGASSEGHGAVGPAVTPAVAGLLEDQLQTYQKIASKSETYPALRGGAAEAYQRIGDLSQRLGRFGDAAMAYRHAISLLDRPDADAAKQLRLARACAELGRVLTTLRQFDEAREPGDRAVKLLTTLPADLAERPESRYELARAMWTQAQRRKPLTTRSFGGDGPPGGPRGGPPDGPPRGGPPGHDKGKRFGPPPMAPVPPGPLWPDDDPAARATVLLDTLVHDHPDVPEYRHLLACALRDTDGPQGSQRLDRAIELLKKLVADNPAVPDYRYDLCESMGRPRPPERGGPNDTRGRERVAEALKIATTLSVEFPRVPDFAAARTRYRYHVGVNTALAGQREAAAAILSEAASEQAALASDYPEATNYTFWLAMIERAQGRVALDAGDAIEGRDKLRGAVARLEALRAADPRLSAVRPQLGMAYRDLAAAESKRGDAAAARAARDRAAEFEGDRAHDPFQPNARPR